MLLVFRPTLDDVPAAPAEDRSMAYPNPHPQSSDPVIWRHNDSRTQGGY